MNSEIVGKPSDLPWAVVFAQPLESAIRESAENKTEEVFLKKKPDSPAGLELKITFQAGVTDEKQAAVFAQQIIPVLISRSNGDEPHVRLPADPKIKVWTDPAGKTLLEMELDGIPRHPAMVYEALSTLILFGLLFFLWKGNPGLPEGRLFGIFVTILFSLRFSYEFLKENQVAFENGLFFNMGQFLSIPLVLAGMLILIWSYRKKSEKNIAS